MINFDIIKKTDEEVYNLIMKEFVRQDNVLEMIASENEPSESTLLAQASYHTLKYAEGYPGARYYGGCRIIDETEQLAINRACQLFNCKFANVQPHSGAQANMAVQFAVLKPGDILMGMSLNSGGHLTHGAKPTFSGKNYNVVQYEVNKDTYQIDYDDLEKQILEVKPNLFIAGASAYPRAIDFKRIKDAINKLDNDCIFMVDMAHIAGLVAAGLHQNPCDYADVVTSTTHKTLRGPRGGLILTNDEKLFKKINKAVFPGIQGGPLENIIAAKAVCFGEALKPEFKEYMKQVIVNNKVLAEALIEQGFNVLTGGTDNHLILLDLTNKGITGAEMEKRLEEIGIIVNKNAVPFDTQNKKTTSGIRIGTAAVTSRGLKEKDMYGIAKMMLFVTDKNYTEKDKDYLRRVVLAICNEYPLYKED